ncbi:Hypothetical protein CINCED_3A020344 [Cinara cedri]|uniref:Reverse transcriptase domain n=1 Tax=Cinara cedri TaxID=506608 RepID=A0A5E4N1C1_9HEMI|nr:Hypothetical protein CINCED_3A020344 [Cinara cedri]
MILGNDWLAQQKIDVRYSSRTFYFPTWNLNVPFSNTTTVPIDYVHPEVTVQECSEDSDDTTDIENNSSLSTITPTMSNDNCEYEPFQNIMDHITSITTIDDSQRQQTIKLFKKYQHVFCTRPGLNSLYTCKFNVSVDTSFKVNPYPIPFSRRPAVDAEMSRMIQWGIVERCSSPYSPLDA